MHNGTKVHKKGGAYTRKLNDAFTNYLSQYVFPEHLIPVLKEVVYTMLYKHATSLQEQSATIKARITELQNKLDALDEKYYIEGAIPADTYEKLKQKLAAEKLQAIEIMSSTPDTSSNLKNCFDLVVAISRKLAPTWRSADFSTREKIQKMLFPDGIAYHFKNEEFRTLKVNKWFEVIPLLASGFSR